MGQVAARQQKGRARARQARIESARKRRLELDTDRLDRERRIDEGVADIAETWESRTQAETAIQAAEKRAAAAIEKLRAEHLSLSEIAHLCACDRRTIIRLRTAHAVILDPESQRSEPLGGDDADV